MTAFTLISIVVMVTKPGTVFKVISELILYRPYVFPFNRLKKRTAWLSTTANRIIHFPVFRIEVNSFYNLCYNTFLKILFAF